MTKRLAFAALLVLSGVVAAQEAPQQVSLNGLMGDKAALLVIDGEAQTLRLGNSSRGVKLLAIEDQRAVVEYGGRRHALALGATPGRVGVSSGPAPSRVIVMPMSQGGHFMATGSINSQSTSFMVDTGATSIAMSQMEADRLGLRYAYGRRIVTQTANGLVPAHVIQLNSVRIGDVEVRNVDAIVLPAQMSHVLLGNSFLNRFQMRRENDVMTLEQRY